MKATVYKTKDKKNVNKKNAIVAQHTFEIKKTLFEFC